MNDNPSPTPTDRERLIEVAALIREQHINHLKKDRLMAELLRYTVQVLDPPRTTLLSSIQAREMRGRKTALIPVLKDLITRLDPPPAQEKDTTDE